jgi:hypothetical protein
VEKIEGAYTFPSFPFLHEEESAPVKPLKQAGGFLGFFGKPPDVKEGDSSDSDMSDDESEDLTEDYGENETALLKQCMESIRVLIPDMNEKSMKDAYKGFIEYDSDFSSKKEEPAPDESDKTKVAEKPGMFSSFWKSTANNSMIVFVLLNVSDLTVSLGQEQCWAITDELTFSARVIDSPVDTDISTLFRRNLQLVFMRHGENETVPIPISLFPCEVLNGKTYENFTYEEGVDRHTAQSILIPKSNHHLLGNHYYFSTRPMDYNHLTHIKRCAVFIEDALYILNEDIPLDSVDLSVKLPTKSTFGDLFTLGDIFKKKSDKIELAPSIEDDGPEETERDFDVISYYIGELEVWCVKTMHFVEL